MSDSLLQILEILNEVLEEGYPQPANLEKAIQHLLSGNRTEAAEWLSANYSDIQPLLADTAIALGFGNDKGTIKLRPKDETSREQLATIVQNLPRAVKRGIKYGKGRLEPGAGPKGQEANLAKQIDDYFKRNGFTDSVAQEIKGNKYVDVSAYHRGVTYFLEHKNNITEFTDAGQFRIDFSEGKARIKTQINYAPMVSAFQIAEDEINNIFKDFFLKYGKEGLSKFPRSSTFGKEEYELLSAMFDKDLTRGFLTVPIDSEIISDYYMKKNADYFVVKNGFFNLSEAQNSKNGLKNIIFDNPFLMLRAKPDRKGYSFTVTLRVSGYNEEDATDINEALPLIFP